MLTTYRICFRIAPWTPDLPEGHGELTVRALGEAEAIETTQEVAPCTESL